MTSAYKTMQGKQIIINADDFGQSEGINHGIIRCFEKGIVTSASFMVRYKTSVTAALYAKENRDLDLGLHVDLGEWTLRNGEWEPLYNVIDMENKVKVQDEINRQVDRFYFLLNQYPSHLDSHQHVHLRDNILPLFTEKAVELNIPLRSIGTHIKYCGLFYGCDDEGNFIKNSINIIGLKKIIESLEVGITEIACHPGLLDDITTMYRERSTEVKTLCDPEIREILNENQIKLRNFRGLHFDDKLNRTAK